MYIPNSGEIVVFTAAFVGACLGFLWFNSYPARVFMGDTGSLALGGGVAAAAIIMEMEMFLPIVGIIYVIEVMSVVIQVIGFKTTGKRIFKMAPLHHHFEKIGMNETKIVAIYIIISAMIGVTTIAITTMV